MSKKTTCPVCFTKMQPLGKDLVCPVCGYKYCAEHVPYTYDNHDHSDYRTYNTKTTYNAHSTSTVPFAGSSSAAVSGYSAGTATGSGNPYSGIVTPVSGNRNASGSDGKQAKNPLAKIITVIAVFYLIGIIFSLIISLAQSFFMW